MIVMGIESSCDETGVGIYDEKKGLIAHVLYSQIKMHAQYGGVVPELASRDHIKRFIPLIKSALNEAKISSSQLDAIAYTAGPGLIGALLVGALGAVAYAKALNIPSVPVHHMEGHLLAPLLDNKDIKCPFVALLVSGGHTMLIKVNKPGSYEILGQSVDDALGEAFDKTAKLLDIPYPGGPLLEKLAQGGDSSAFKFPRPMIDRDNCDFSFAGLKTAVLNEVHKLDNIQEQKANLSRCFTDAVVDVLVKKCSRALDKTKLNTLVVAGGVSANNDIRQALVELMQKRSGQAYFARKEFCTDNGAMIAFAGMYRFKAGFIGSDSVDVFPRWDLCSLEAL